jgi:hypothetical protein
MGYRSLGMASLACRVSQITLHCLDWVRKVQHLGELLRSLYFVARRLRSQNLDMHTILRLETDWLRVKEKFTGQQWSVLPLVAFTDDWEMASIWCGAKFEPEDVPDDMELDFDIYRQREFFLRFLIYMVILEVGLLTNILELLMASVEEALQETTSYGWASLPTSASLRTILIDL